MRILNVIHSVNPESGGPAEGLRQMCQATHRLGHLQEALTLDAPHEPWVDAFPAPVHAVGPRVSNYGYTSELQPWLRASARNYDAIIVHGLWQYQGLATWRALRGENVPYFVYPHGMLDPWFKQRYPLKHFKKQLYWHWAEERVLRDAAAVLFTTDEEARLAAQTFAPYRARALTMGYGLALDATAQAATAEDFFAEHGELRGSRLILFLGRIHEKKGCDLLIEAFAMAAAAHPGLHLVMAGPDQTGIRPELERLAERLGVAARITWTGMLTGKVKWGALRAAEVFALPSHQENFGVAVAEALAVGLPVLLSTQVNIWREIVEDGAGLAAADDLPGTLRVLQQWLTMSAAQRRAMQRRAQACFAQRFHVDAAARCLLATIQQHKPVHSQP
jgi:glycosyltransferase involved in cell wall biosynthesis